MTDQIEASVGTAQPNGVQTDAAQVSTAQPSAAPCTRQPGWELLTSSYDYELPESHIAQEPIEPRDACKLLVLHRKTGNIEHRHFYDIGEYIDDHDLLVANETRVLPARLIGRKTETHGACECLLLSRREDLDPAGLVWECLVKPGRRLHQGSVIEFCAEMPTPILQARILDHTETRGGRLVAFEPQGGRTLDEAIHEVGAVPLPPYIRGYTGDTELYQTVYATHEERSAAAPTAGLHFTPALISELKARGIDWQTVELEVGIDTFRVVDEERITDHQMHTERYHVSQEVVDAIAACKERQRRVIAVGTTSVRSLESAWDADAQALLARQAATTDLFLYPGRPFHVIDAMITNFHVPRSTLMMLVSAFGGYENIMRAYREAIEHNYRMLSFGDAMLII